MKALSEHRGDSEELHRMFGRSKQRMCDSSQQSVRSSKRMLYNVLGKKFLPTSGLSLDEEYRFILLDITHT
jgi:hypothetical protein